MANNDKVSRSHADIITRNGKYFIIDLNSKNAMNLFLKDAAFALDKASLMITKKDYDEALFYLDSIQQNMETDQDIRHARGHDIKRGK